MLLVKHKRSDSVSFIFFLLNYVLSPDWTLTGRRAQSEAAPHVLSFNLSPALSITLTVPETEISGVLHVIRKSDLCLRF